MAEFNEKETQAMQILQMVAANAARSAIEEVLPQIRAVVTDGVKALIEQEVKGLLAKYDEQLRLIAQIEAKAKMRSLNIRDLQTGAEKRAYAVMIATIEQSIIDGEATLRKLQAQIYEAQEALAKLAGKYLGDFQGETSGFVGDSSDWKRRLSSLENQYSSMRAQLGIKRQHLSNARIL